MADTNKLNDPSRSPLGGHPQPDPGRLHKELQADPELTEGPASSSRLVVYSVAIVVVLGAVFYGLNATSTTTEGINTAATQTTPAAAPPNNAGTAEQSPPAGENAQATSNTAPGTTTGAAVPSNTQGPKSTPTGTEIDRSKGGNSATK